MRFLWSSLLAIVTVSSLASQSSARELLGFGRLLNNDALANTKNDRWRTGSGVISAVWAKDPSGGLPSSIGDMLEFRFQGEVITPENLVTPGANDRPYAAALSFGAHTHFTFQTAEISLGADLVVTGPQTGLPRLQETIHDLLGVPEPSAATLNAQIPNGFHGSANLEIARQFKLFENFSFRPFVEVKAGVETLARIGGDFHFGRLAQGDFLLRDSVTGQRYRVGRDDQTGWAAVFGGDIAYVADSLYLPASGAATLSDTRHRVRAGVHWQGKSVGLFYGVTWLSKEFDQQSSEQTIGSLRVDFSF